MNKNILLKYMLMYVPFVLGIVLFSFGIYNVFSSLLLFVGGYVAVKNTFDYRKIRKNAENVKIVNDTIKQKEVVKRNPENMVGFKRTRRYGRVRKRIKY